MTAISLLRYASALNVILRQTRQSMRKYEASMLQLNTQAQLYF